MRCSACKFWVTGKDPSPWATGMGECRRLSPMPWAERDAKAPEPRAVFTYWPMTLDEQFCGEYAPRHERKGFV